MEPMPTRNLVLSLVATGGNQRILLDGYLIMLDINNGMADLHCHPPTTRELETLPHIIMKADVNWSPIILDNVIDDVETLYDATDKIIILGLIDQDGEY
jgi:hypothetical protein